MKKISNQILGIGQSVRKVTPITEDLMDVMDEKERRQFTDRRKGTKRKKAIVTLVAVIIFAAGHVAGKDFHVVWADDFCHALIIGFLGVRIPFRRL